MHSIWRHRPAFYPRLYLLPLLFLAAFYVYPLLAIFRVSFAAPGAGFGVLELLQRPQLWAVLWFTGWQAALSTVLTLLAGMPLAYIFGVYTFPGKALLHACLAIPFVMPTVVVATAFLSLVGRNGLFNQWLQQLFGLTAPPLAVEQSLWLILAAHVFFNVSVIIRTVGAFWGNLNPHLREAAAVLGASPPRVFWTVTLPLLLPSILSASLLVFLFCFTSFGVILILGGPTFATLEVEIYRQAVDFFNLPLAAVLCLVQMAVTFTVMVFYTRAQARTSRSLRAQSQAATLRRPHSRAERAAITSLILVTMGALFLPLVALAVRSFTLGGEFTFQYYVALTENPRQSAFFAPPASAIGNSLLYATGVLLLSLPLGVIAAYLLARPRSLWASILEPLLLLPLGTSAVTLGFGYIVALGPLRTSFWLVPIAHTMIALPFVVRIFLPSLRALDQRLREAAAVLGATPAQVWRFVDAPLLLRPFLVAAAFAFAISLGEFGATLLIARPDMPTMPMVIYRALGRPGALNYGQALAMSTLLMVVTGAALFVIERFQGGEGGEF